MDQQGQTLASEKRTEYYHSRRLNKRQLICPKIDINGCIWYGNLLYYKANKGPGTVETEKIATAITY